MSLPPTLVSVLFARFRIHRMVRADTKSLIEDALFAAGYDGDNGDEARRLLENIELLTDIATLSLDGAFLIITTKGGKVGRVVPVSAPPAGSGRLTTVTADRVDELRRILLPSCSSFHGDTLVLAKRGYVPIREITATGGYWVRARHEVTGRMGWRPVTATTVAQYDETVHVTIRDVETGDIQVIRSDRQHPYFAQRGSRGAVHTVAITAPPPSSHGHIYQGPIAGGAWIDAQHLRAGDRLINADGTWAEVVGVRVDTAALTAHNLSVEGLASYFVSESFGHAPVWVHNVDPDCFPTLNRYIAPRHRTLSEEVEAEALSGSGAAGFERAFPSGGSIKIISELPPRRADLDGRRVELELAVEIASTTKSRIELRGTAEGADWFINGRQVEIKQTTITQVNTLAERIKNGVAQGSRVIIDTRLAKLSKGEARQALDSWLRGVNPSDKFVEISIYTRSGRVTYSAQDGVQ